MEYLSDKSSVARMDKNLEKISPFELKNRLIEMADESVKKMAGEHRGGPSCFFRSNSPHTSDSPHAASADGQETNRFTPEREQKGRPDSYKTEY